MKLIIAQKEGVTALFLKQTFRELGYEVVFTCSCAQDLFGYLERERNIDAVFMDLELKGPIDGIRAAHTLRQRSKRTKIIFTSSFSDEYTMENASFVDPEGFLIKPIARGDLEAVLQTLQNPRKGEQSGQEHILFGPYRYDLRSRRVYENRGEIDLTKRELHCLELLLHHKGSHLSKEQLTMQLWNTQEDKGVALRELIYRLRKKLPKAAIASRVRVGYMIK